MRDPRTIPHKIPINQIPVWLEEIVLQCEACKHSSPIPWFEKLEWPWESMPSNDGTVKFVRVSFNIPCPKCSEPVQVNIPIVENKGRFFLYGDEADRHEIRAHESYSKVPLDFLSITLVGCNPSRRSELDAAILNHKLAARPTIDPTTWSLHFTDIWSSDPDDGFAFLTKQSKIDYALAICTTIRNFAPELFYINSSGCIPDASGSSIEAKKDRKANLKQAYRSLFSSILLSSATVIRRQFATPKWIFDHRKKMKSGINKEGWAKEIFDGLRFTPAFGWIAGGADIEAPEFVPAGSNSLLELADFIGFIIARDFQQSAEKKIPIDIPSSNLGVGRFLILRKDDAIDIPARGLPMKQGYGINRV